MATTTRPVFRERISDAVGDWYGTLTADSGSTTTIVDTELNDLPFGGDDDSILNWYVIVTDGNNIGEVRRVSAYVASTNTITVSRAFTNTIVTHTYEVHRFSPADYHSALNRALEELFPFLYLPIRDESIIIDNLLTNSLLNTFSGGFTDWTEVGSPTVTQDATIAIEGGSSAKVVAAGADGQMTQAPTVNIPSMIGKTVTAKRWVYTTSASAARLRIDFGGAVISDSTDHTGADQWEHLSVSAEIPEGATQVKMILEVTDGSTAYFDFGSMVIEPIYNYTLPANLKLGPYQVWIQISENDPNAGFIPLVGRPLEGRRLRLIGKGLLTATSSETSTVEVGDNQTELVISQALVFLNRQMASRAASRQRQRYLDDMVMWQDQVNALRRTPGVRSPFIGAHYESGLLENQWYVEETSTGRTLVLRNSRGTIESFGFSHLI